MNGGCSMAVIALTTMLAGCVASTPIRTADGRQAYAIDCGSGQLSASWTGCYEKAGEICGAHGYNIVERIGEQGYSIYMGQYGGAGASDFNRSLIIACKKG
jgi:hypothetical protein